MKQKITQNDQSRLVVRNVTSAVACSFCTGFCVASLCFAAEIFPNAWIVAAIIAANPVIVAAMTIFSIKQGLNSLANSKDRSPKG
jgi:hypothetical protein